MRNLFRLKKKVKGIKNTVIRNIKDLFEYEKKEENYYKPVRVNNFEVIIILNTEMIVTKIEYYQLKNIFIKLDHI